MKTFKQISEMSMSVTLKPKKNNMYKVTGVGKKMAAHGGIKKGEKFHDSEIDGMNDSGIKVKYQKPKKMGEEMVKDQITGKMRVKGPSHVSAADINNATKKNKLKKVNERNTAVKEVPMKAKFKVGKAKPIPGNPDYKGPQNPKMKVKLNKTPGNMKAESIQRRMDRMAIIATDPATGRKVVKIAPKKQVDIGKGKNESVQVDEISTGTLASYQKKAGAQYKQAKVDSDEKTAYKPFSIKGGQAADAAEKIKNKRGKGLGQSKKILDKRYSDKQVKMGKGIAFDKRYKGGNMTGASKAINKIKGGLSDHPKVSGALRRANEEFNKGE